MKLIFLDLTIRNFLSIGSKAVTINYRKGLHAITGKIEGHPTTNGSGKSTIGIDGLVVALYGKSPRDIPQDKLINSINKNECELTLRFLKSNRIYRIERGFKPNYLRLIDEEKEKNGELEKEESAKKLTQKDIDDIIGIDMKSFLNSVSLNINYSTPFFNMKTQQKREFLENILNLNIYGDMLEECKKDLTELNRATDNATTELDSLIKNYKSDIEIFKNLENAKKSFEDDKKTKLETITNDIEKLNDERRKYDFKEKDTKSIKNKINEKLTNLKIEKSNIDSEIKNANLQLNKINEKIEKLTISPVCGECGTPTTSDHIQNHIKELNNSISELGMFKQTKEKEKEELIHNIEILNSKLKEIDNYEIKINNIKEKINEIDNKLLLKNREYEIENKREFMKDSILSKEVLLTKKKTIETKKEKLQELKKQQKICEKTKELLGEKGIKSYIVRKILPILNKKMNGHIANLKGNYTIKFDQELNETIKSRNRDVFLYENFSSGEKKRLDIAWMLTLLDIAKMRNSIDCNILMLDEILDSSMCINGIQNLMDYLKTDFRKDNPDVGVYIITHKSEIKDDDFNTIIRVKKTNGFTHIDRIDEIEQVVQL